MQGSLFVILCLAMSHKLSQTTPAPMIQIARLTRELLDIGGLARNKRQRDDTRDVHLWAVDVHVEAKLLTNTLDVLETLLVIGSGTTNPDLDLVLNKLGGNLPQGADDALECGGDICEVGNATTDEQNLTLRVLRSAEHEVKDGTGVVEGLGLSGSTRVLTVVGKLAGESGGGDGVGVDDRRTTTSHEGPHPTDRIENGKLQRSTSLSIHLGDISLLLAHLTAKRSWELHGWTNIDCGLGILLGSRWYPERSGAASNSPFGTALELSSLVNLCSKIQEMNLGRSALSIGDDNKRVDLKVALNVCQ